MDLNWRTCIYFCKLLLSLYIAKTIIIIVNTIINVGEIPANVISYLGLKINTNQFLKSLFYR